MGDLLVHDVGGFDAWLEGERDRLRLAFQDAGLGLGVYTVNSTEAYDESVELGVDRVTGDFPIQFSRYERELKVFPQNTGVQITDCFKDRSPKEVPMVIVAGHAPGHRAETHATRQPQRKN